jgi:hypothetical protein
MSMDSDEAYLTKTNTLYCLHVSTWWAPDAAGGSLCCTVTVICSADCLPLGFHPPTHTFFASSVPCVMQHYPQAIGREFSIFSTEIFARLGLMMQGRRGHLCWNGWWRLEWWCRCWRVHPAHAAAMNGPKLLKVNSRLGISEHNLKSLQSQRTAKCFPIKILIKYLTG